jgi:GT2 family glycosyltransferase
MKVRYRGQGVKRYRYCSEYYDIPSDKWTTVEKLDLFKKLKSFPSVFDTVQYFDLRQFEPIQDYLTFKDDLVYVYDRGAVRKLDRMAFVRKQAHLPERGLYIYKIIKYDNQNMSRLSKVSKTVNALVYRSLGGIGDIIMTTPILEAAYRKFPGFKITYSCPNEFLPLVENNPFVDNIVSFNDSMTKEDWDVVSDLTSDCIKYEIDKQPNVDINRSEIFSSKCGLGLNDLPSPKIFLTEQEILDAKEELADIKDNIKFGLILKSNATVRTWPYFDQLRGQLLSEYPNSVTLEFCKSQPAGWNPPSDRTRGVFGSTLRKVAALLNECDVVVSPDTGLAHISSALRVPTVWIFTHIDGEIRTRGYDNIWIVQETPENCPKGQPCWYEIPCSRSPQNQKEIATVPPCAEAIPSEKVLEAVSAAIQQPNLSYIVVYKDNLDLTSKCLSLIKEYKRAGDEIVVVDNGSMRTYCDLDGCENMKFIKNSENLGCIIGRNQGMIEANGRFLLTLDNDQFISAHTTHMLSMTDGDIVGSEGWSMDVKGYAFNIEKGMGELAYVGGGGMLVRKSLAEKIGYLTEDYAPAWFSDPDFCFKAVKDGYSLGCQRNSGITHLKHKTVLSQTDFDSDSAWKRSHRIFLSKWSSELREQGVIVPQRVITNLIKGDRPTLSVYMLSWLRYGVLKKVLKGMAKSTRMPIEFYLRVQAGEKLTNGTRDMIKDLVSVFPFSRLEFTNSNQGTAGPRKRMVGDFIERSNCKYLCLADDDILFNDYSFEYAVAYMEENPDIGGVGIPHKPWGFYLNEGPGFRRLDRINLTQEVTYVDVLGSGHSIFRREALMDMEIDIEYFVGAWDWDMTMQISRAGWKLVILDLDNIGAQNLGGGDAEYRKVRSDKENKKRTVDHFKRKFNLGKQSL